MPANASSSSALRLVLERGNSRHVKLANSSSSSSSFDAVRLEGIGTAGTLNSLRARKNKWEALGQG